MNLLQQGQTEEQVLSGLAGQHRIPQSRSDDDYVGDGAAALCPVLYGVLLDRTGSDADVAGWINALPTLGQSGVAMRILSSTEFRTDQFEGYYNALWHRPDDQPGLSDWVFSNLDMKSVAPWLRVGSGVLRQRISRERHPGQERLCISAFRR